MVGFKNVRNLFIYYSYLINIVTKNKTFTKNTYFGALNTVVIRLIVFNNSKTMKNVMN